MQNGYAIAVRNELRQALKGKGLEAAIFAPLHNRGPVPLAMGW